MTSRGEWIHNLRCVEVVVRRSTAGKAAVVFLPVQLEFFPFKEDGKGIVEIEVPASVA